MRVLLQGLACLMVAFSLISTVGSTVAAGEYEIVAKAKTSGGTSAGGVRQSNTSPWEKITLSSDEFFNPSDPEVYRAEWIAQRGDTDYTVEWDDYAQVFPGLNLPQTLRVRTHCRSPKVPPLSNVGVGGVAEIRIKAKSFKKS